jgi:hypothetical protein
LHSAVSDKEVDLMGTEPPLTISAEGSEEIGSLADVDRRVAPAWESFASGDLSVQGVRPEILASWYRCRDQYEVDPHLTLAPNADDRNDHRFDHDVLFAQLGGLAAMAGQAVELDGGVVAVTDGSGRILASYGDPHARKRASESNLAPWSVWAEEATGTNGMGTALEVEGPVTVTGAEHWCAGFHHWACAGIAVRDIVTGNPVATVNVSRWRKPLSHRVPDWLRKVAGGVEREISSRAVADGNRVVTRFNEAVGKVHAPFLGLDLGGKVIIANDAAISLLDLPKDTGAVDPASRRLPDIPELSDVVRWAARNSLSYPHWRGYARLAVRSPDSPMPMRMQPLFEDKHLIGLLCEFGAQEGEPYENGDDIQPVVPQRVIGVRNDRLIVLAPSEIRYAEADRNIVWLATDRGRIQASTRGLDHVDHALAPHGFCRVHRRFLVNLRRVVELERGIKGELLLITDPRMPEFVPVSRRHAPAIRRAFGI